MRPRPASGTLESLRVTLLKLEQTSDPDVNDASIAELKRILVNRIAELASSDTVSPGEAIGPIQPESPE